MSLLKNQSTGDLIFKLSLLLVFIAMTAMSFSFGITGDEVDMNNYGKAILRYFASFGNDEFIFSGDRSFDRDGVIKYYGGLFDFVAALVNKISPFEEYTTRHILSAWMGFVAIFFSAKIAKRLSNTTGATLVVWLIFLSPFFLGHAMNNPKDIPFAATYIMSIYLIIRFFDKFPKVSWKDYLYVILAIGATINIRVGGILLIPYLFVFVGILFLHKKLFLKEEFKLSSFIKPLLIISACGYLAGSILWPYALQNPFTNPLTALGELSDFKIRIGQIWEGAKVASSDLPSSYLIKSFGMTNTFAILIGLILGIVLLLKNLKKKQTGITLFVLFTGLFPVLYIMYSGSNVYHAWRHVLFIFPALAIIASLGYVYLSELLPQKAKIAAIALAAILLLEPLYFTATTLPHTNTYHNAFAGGVKEAYGNYEVDFYYNSLKQATDWFKENEYKNIEESAILLTNAFDVSVPYFKDHRDKLQMDYVRYNEINSRDWDYLMLHIALVPLELIQSEGWLNSKAIYVGKVQGKPLCAIFKRKSKDDMIGMQLLKENKIDSAITAFERYIQVDSANPAVLNQLANIYLQKNDIPKATYYSTLSYNIDPTNIETKYYYAQLTIGTNAALAANLLKEVLAASPNFVQAYYYLGLAQQTQGQVQEALNSFNTAAQAPQLSAAAYKAMGDIYKQQGNQDQAQKLYKLSQGLPSQ